jgi:hypothetical protein
MLTGAARWHTVAIESVRDVLGSHVPSADR